MKRRVTLILSLLMLAMAPQISLAQDDVSICVKEFPPFVFKDLKGFCIDVANVIARRHDLTPRFVMTDSVPDLINKVQQGHCDVGFSGITITAERERRVDFSQPFFDSGLMIATTLQPGSQIMSTARLIARLLGFSFIFFFIALSIIAHLIWLIERDDDDHKSFDTTYRRGIVDAYWWSVVTMTTVGYGDKCPKRISGRLIAAFWMIIGIIWFAGFTATLSSALTSAKVQQSHIQSLADLEGKRVGVIRGTTSESYLRYHEVKTVKTKDLDSLMALLKSRGVEAVVYDAPTLMYLAKRDPDIQVAGEMFDRQRYGIVFPQDSPDHLREIFDIEILSMTRSGEYQRIYDKWF